MRGIMEKNGMRGVIRDVFSTRSCLWLPHPGCNTRDLGSMPDGKMETAFVQVWQSMHMNTLCRHVPLQ